MTFLELVNAVLGRLREATVTSVTVDPYVVNIGTHVNDAKRHVEQAWQWAALRDSQTVTLSQSDTSFVLPDSDNPDYVIKGIFNETHSSAKVEEMTLEWYRAVVAPLSSVSEGRINYVYPLSISKTTHLRTLGVHNPPDSSQTLRVDSCFSQPDLSDASDELWIPSLPVVLIASATAARERGEVGGAPMAEWMINAEKALADAIAYDSAHYANELVFDAGYTWHSNNRM